MKLVRFYDGVDGLKTGFTQGAGYCLTATAKKNNMRLVSVVMGVSSSDERSSDTTNMLNYGFNTYELYTTLKKESVLGTKRVEYGKKEKVDIVLKDDYVKLLKQNDKKPDYTYEVNVDKIKAPVNVGDVVGKVKIIEDGNVVDEVDVTVLESISKSSLFDYWYKNIGHMVNGKYLI